MSWARAVLVTSLAVSAACGRARFEEVVVDGATSDGVLADGQLIDRDAALGPCTPAGPGDLALFTFDLDEGTSLLVDQTGTHSGAQIGALEFTDGRAGCGRALRFAGDVDRYGVIANHVDWDLVEGSLELWLRVDSLVTTSHGVVSRDAFQRARPGHFTLEVDSLGRLFARIQGDGTEVAVVCSDTTVPLVTWRRVGINVGAPRLELWIDGVRQLGTGTVAAWGEVFDCTDGTLTGGIAGNDNPWVLGASSFNSDEGEATPVSHPFSGAIDHFRISSARRTFSGP